MYSFYHKQLIASIMQLICNVFNKKERMSTMQNVRIYARVSTAEQKKKDISIPVQIDACRRYCTDHNYNIVGTYIDNGYSASSIKKRKEFKRMIEDVRRDEYILFTRLDRFSRNILDANKIVEALDKKNVSIVSIFEDDINTSTADGRFMFNLRVSLSQREIEKDSERILDVMQAKVAKGEVLTGRLPVGYKIENKKPVIDKSQIEMVKDTFSTYIDTGNWDVAARILSKKYNTYISDTKVRGIIKNRRYIGEFRGIKNYFPRIIDDETFFEANNISKNKYVKHSKNEVTYLFSGLLRCEFCGRRMASSHRKNLSNSNYYICSRRENGKTAQHFAKSERKIELALLNEFEKLLNDRILELDKAERKRNTLSEDNISKIKNLKTKMKRIKNLYIDGFISENEFKSKYSRTEKELLELEMNCSTDIEQKRERYQYILDNKILTLYKTFSREQKAIFWRTIIDHIVVHKDDSLDIFLR